jgi:hypothetical protein
VLPSASCWQRAVADCLGWRWPWEALRVFPLFPRAWKNTVAGSLCWALGWLVGQVGSFFRKGRNPNWATSSYKACSPVRAAVFKGRKPCPATPASFFTSAKIAGNCCARSPAIVVCFAVMVRLNARPSSSEKIAAYDQRPFLF